MHIYLSNFPIKIVKFASFDTKKIEMSDNKGSSCT